MVIRIAALVALITTGTACGLLVGIGTTTESQNNEPGASINDYGSDDGHDGGTEDAAINPCHDALPSDESCREEAGISSPGPDGCTATCAGKACDADDGCGGRCSSQCRNSEEIILFGGQVGERSDDIVGDTWIWNGNAWTFRETNGPAPHSGHHMAALDGSAVLFGATSDLHDLWIWSGTSWTERAAGSSGPPSAIALARHKDKLVALRADSTTWEWDGTRWTQRSVSGPSPSRITTSMATLGDKVVLFGGWGLVAQNLEKLGDTWEWDGNAWTKIATTGPSKRYGHAMATLDNKVVLFGGVDSQVYSDTWEWDGAHWTDRHVSGPRPRSMHAMATANHKVLMFGGENGSGLLDDTWEWDATTWTQRTTPGPSARSNHGMASF